MNILNKESGVLWIAGISNDMRDIYAGIDQWNDRCQLALDMYVNSLIKYIWSYVAILGGVDAIVLTGGVMEHKALIRKLLLQKLNWLWITLDQESNPDEISQATRISTEDSKVAVFVIPTNEELMIAEQTFGLMKNV